MRSLKTFMRNRKKEMLACGSCECRTLQCWRYANENCGCGDAAASVVGNKVYAEIMDSETGTSKVRLFTTGESGKDYILAENQDRTLVGIFNSVNGEELLDTINGYIDIFTIGKGGAFPAAGTVGTIDADAMALVRKVFEDPSEENKQELTSFLQAHMEAIQQGDVNAFLVTYPAKTSILIIPQSWEVDVLEQIIIQATVSPNDESITAVSSDPSILRVDSVEKDTTASVNVYKITCTGVASGTATVTATCVNDPSVSATTPTITVRR